jgi:hypothetical protein
MIMEEQKMTTTFFTFDAAIPVPEKAKALKLDRYAHLAWRNFTIKVKVTFPERAHEFGLIQLPEQKRHHSGYLQIVMEESLKDSVTFDVTREDVAKLNLLGVQYFPHDEPGKIMVVLELPPPVAVVEKVINLPRVVHGEFCSNAAVSLIVNNVVGTNAPHQDSKSRGRYARREKPLNHRLHLMNNFQFNNYCNRADPSDEIEIKSTFFWPSMCTLLARTTGDMLQPTNRLVERDEETGVVSEKHPALQNAHPNLLQSIADELLSFYVIPEMMPQTGWHREFAMAEFHRLVSAWDSKIVSAAVQGEGKFLPHTEKQSDFFCCMGVNDSNKGQTQLTHACFGRFASIYKMRGGPGGRKSVERDEKGNPRLMPPYSGYAVVLQFKTMFQVLAALYGAFANGDMDTFYEQHLLLFPDELFLSDDYETKQCHQKQLKAQRDAAGESNGEGDDEAEEDEEASDSDAEPGDGEPNETSLEVEFGDNSDKVGGQIPEPDQEPENE